MSSLTLHAVYADSSNDNVYVDIINKSEKYVPEGVTNSFAVDFQKSILDNPRDYYISLIAFSIPLQALPLYIVKPISPGSNTLVYKFRITYGGTSLLAPSYTGTEVSVIFEPSANYATDSPYYYYCYTYDQLVKCFNKAIETAVNAFYTAAPASPQAVDGGIPFFLFNTNFGKLQLYSPKVWATNASGAVPSNTAYISTNLTESLKFFETMLVFENVIAPDNNGYFQIYDFNLNQVSIPATETPPNFVITTQDGSCMYNWNSLSKIIVTTDMPIAQEFIQSNLDSQSVNGSGSGSSLISQLAILTTFTPILTTPLDARSIAIYNPGGQYRLIDIITDTPIQRISFRLFWQTTDLEILPLLLPNYVDATLKLGFFRRSLYKNIKCLDQGDPEDRLEQSNIKVRSQKRRNFH